MKGAVVLFVLLLIFWLLLSGFSYQELAAGIVVSAIIAAVAGYGFFREWKSSYFKGFFIFLGYLAYYLAYEVIDTLDVSYRIITGKINPAIVEVPHSHTHEWGITMLSNSLTMMPGTLTLEAEPEKLYVHWLNMHGTKKEIAGRFEKILKNIWD